MPWIGPTIGAGASLLGGLFGGDEQTSTTTNQMDPAMRAILYGNGRTLKPGVQEIRDPATGQISNPQTDYNVDNGFIGRITDQIGTPQKAGMSILGQSADNYLGSFGNVDMDQMRNAATRLRESGINAPTMAGAQINAPSQNGVNLQPAYQDMVYGQAGNNPYLTGAIQKGLNQANTNFQNLQTDTTRNLMENVMPGIRSGARVSGSYGGNREGLAQGKAFDTFNTQMGRALSQVGQNGQDAAVSAQAGAYGDDRNRALQAMQGLGAQQYGVASQNAQFQQQAGLANQQSQLSTNAQNAANTRSGIDATSGILGQVAGLGQNNDSYDLNRVGKIGGMLGQFTGLGGSTTSSSPLYSNPVAGMAGGAILGGQLMNGYNSGGGGYNDEMARLNAQSRIGG